MLTRRRFLSHSGAAAAGFLGLRDFLCGSDYGSREASAACRYGELIPDPHGLVDLPQGFTYEVFSRTGEAMSDGLLVPASHDGMAAFPGPGGKTILVRNHELDAGTSASGPFGERLELFGAFHRERLYDLGHGAEPAVGGTTTLLYDTRTQRLEKHFLSLAGTVRNCAGGPTPWGTWITCEETELCAEEPLQQDHGFNFEVAVSSEPGLAKPRPLKEMGRFRHEAVAVHRPSGIVYQTEDLNDGLLYRYIPYRRGVLAAGGRLQALALRDRKSADTRNWGEAIMRPGVSLAVRWVDLEDVTSPQGQLRYQGFAQGAARFSRGEGIWSHGERIYFVCTDGGVNRWGQIWRYTASPAEGTAEEARNPGRLELFLEPNDSNLLECADNLTIAPWGDIFLSEDGAGVDHLVGITPEGALYRFARNALNQSEFAGPTFSPDGSTLFVNVQNPGLTLAITGQWRRV